ncbi:MAG TPA: hypothetical protein VFW93_03320 [Aquabacterium sp.]|uniref:lipopolysaccharide biosynthesis protein n=1 Tax=Aquabacterium sp. TaxID=1872578 RepID=UPI002E3071FD|nr:hypothetical protein [Aquabacterium sp.]HEX5355222.1 hypothetical protein [Aquabacterium sp.]
MSHSLIDQAILSASNFLIGLVFIKFATKHEYYAFSQIIGYNALTLALQGAVVNTTALTLLPQKDDVNRAAAARAFFGLQLVLSLFLAVVGGLAIWAVPSSISMDEVSVNLALGMALLILATWLREFLRNVQFINMRPDLCLRNDLIYVLVLVAAIGGLVLEGSVRADSMLLLVGSVGVGTGLLWALGAGIKPVVTFSAWRTLWKEVWPLARWSLPAGVVAWAFGNAYLLIGARMVGPEGTAEIVAAKLFTAPLGMLFLSWANIFRPKVSQSITKGEVASVGGLTRLSMIGVVIIVVLYCGALTLSYPYLETYLLGEKYKGLRVDIAWWGLFFLASGMSGVCNGVLLAGGHFRQSFYAAAGSSVVSIGSMLLLSWMYGKNGLMAGAVMGEACYAGILFLGMRAMLRNVPDELKRGNR